MTLVKNQYVFYHHHLNNLQLARGQSVWGRKGGKPGEKTSTQLFYLWYSLAIYGYYKLCYLL